MGLLGHTDTTQPAPAKGMAALRGFSGGGYSTSGEIFDAVFDDAEKNNSMFGLHQEFQDLYQENSKRAFDLVGENIPGFETLRFKDVARSLYEGEGLGLEDQGDYTLDLDQVNEKLKKLKEKNPEILTFEEMYARLKNQAGAIERRAADVLSRADTFGDVVGFMSGMVGAFNKNDPLNIASLAIGGWGKAAMTRIATEVGVGGLAETINQVLGVTENRKLLGLDNSIWRAAQQVLFAAGGAGVFRGTIEVAPVGFRAVERKVAPNRAAGRELLRALEDVGVPVRSEVFLQKTIELAPEKITKRATTRAAQQVLDQERRFIDDNALGGTPEGIAEHYRLARVADEEYRAGLEDEMNGVEPPRTSLFDGMNLRGVGEARGVPLDEVNEILDIASRDVDAELAAKSEDVGQINDDVVKLEEGIREAETRPFSDFLRDVSPERADELAQIEQKKAMPGLGKARRGRLAKAEQEIRNSPEGRQATADRKATVAEGNKAVENQNIKLREASKEVRALERRRGRIRDKAQKGIDTRPKKIKTPSEDKARAEGVRLEDAEAPRIPGIGNRGGLSPAENVRTTMERLREADPELARRMDEAVARVDRSLDEADGTYDIGASRRVSGEMMVGLDDGTSRSLRGHLDDIAENEKLVEAVKVCSI